MKQITLFALLVLCLSSLHAQNGLMETVRQAGASGQRFERMQVFTSASPVDTEMKKVLSEGNILQLDPAVLRQLYAANLPAIELVVPLSNGQHMNLLLLQQQMLTDDFRVTTSAPVGRYTEIKPGRYYSGVVKGSSLSLVAVSFFENDIIGVIETAEEGTMELGKLENDPAGRYALFPTAKLQFNPQFECGMEHIEQPKPIEDRADSDIPKSSLNCVRIYFECEYDMYLANGSSVQNTVNYMTGVYNVVKTLYGNDGINTTISEIFVWNTPDSYPTTSTSDALSAFRAARANNFNGNLAHLVSRGAPTGGGIAYLDVTCNKSFAFAYSYIYQNYSQFPTYSWTVMVIAHEMGHNLGSPHTHNCSWDVNGDGVAGEMIDGCGPQAGYSEGNCTTAPLPANGGTIMSYCHLIGGVGINLNNGFGPLPKARIQNRVYNATCLTACSNCAHTVSITKTDVVCNGASTGSATANVSGSGGPYTYAWSNGATTQTISNLAAGTYSITVYNNANCPVAGAITINQPAALTLSSVVAPESFPGTSDGAVDLTVSGGTPPYTYAWSNGATTQDIGGLAGGTYTVTVTYSGVCQGTRTALVPTLTCTNQVNNFPFVETFESGFGLWEQPTSDDFDWLRWQGATPTKNTGPAGAYQGTFYVYTESDGNTNETALLVSPCLNFSNKINRSVSFAYSMNGTQMGTLSLQASADNGATWATIWSRTGNQGAGWLFETVGLDAFSGSATRLRFVGAVGGGVRSDMAIDAVTVNAAAAPCNTPVLSMASTPVSCSGGTDGSAGVMVSGGVAPYAYIWSNGAQTSSITGLPAGNYSVTVTGSNGCASTDDVTVQSPAAISLAFSVIPVSSTGAQDGQVNLTVSGGTPPYQFNWSNGAQTEDLQGVGAGNYTVTVTDGKQCTVVSGVTVGVAASCTPVAAIPYEESFESGFGLWSQSTEDQMDWTRNQGSTPTSQTGPTGAFDGTFYVYTEATGNTNKTAILNGPCFDLSNMISPSFRFAYHMYGSNMGSLFCEISTDAGGSWTPLWSRSGNQGTSWLLAAVDLSGYIGQVVRMRFRGVTGGGQRSDMAVDQVRLLESGGIPEGLSAAAVSLLLRPNPASEEVFLQFQSDSNEAVQGRVIDFSGRTILVREFETVEGRNEWSLPVSQLPNGIYWVVLWQQGKERITQKFIVQH